MGGNKRAEPFQMYVDQTIRAFLAVRKYRELFINIVELITKSTLGCFNPKSIQVKADLPTSLSERGSWRTKMTIKQPSR